VGVAGVEVAGRASGGGDEEEMAALVADKGVPMAIEERGDDLRFDFGGCMFFIAGLVAGVGVGAGRAVGVDL